MAAGRSVVLRPISHPPHSTRLCAQTLHFQALWSRLLVKFSPWEVLTTWAF